jgi:ABC-2 type transport system permease protein
MSELQLPLILPVVILAAWAVLVLLMAPFYVETGRGFAAGVSPWSVSLLGVSFGAWACVRQWQLVGPDAATTAYGMVHVDRFGIYLSLLVLAVGFMTLLFSARFLEREGAEQGEFYALTLFALAGMVMMLETSNLMMLLVGLEIFSLALYVLCGLTRGRVRSIEAALKYFLLGAFSSGFLVFGLALLYGAAGSLNLAEIARAADEHPSAILTMGLGLVIVLPLFFVIFQNVHQRHDRGAENIFASQITQSGLATPVLMLLFLSVFMLPLAAALVAGDIVATEDGNGTLKTILTRSVTRGQLFAAKVGAAITYALLALVAMAAVSITEATIAWGFNPITSLSGTTVSAWRGLVLVLASLGVYALPLLAITTIGVLLSTVTRNSAGAVVGALMIALLMQLIGILPGVGAIKPYLLTTQFDAWHGFLRTPIDWAPITRGGWVSAVYAAVSLAGAYLVFLRRDVAGG